MDEYIQYKGVDTVPLGRIIFRLIVISTNDILFIGSLGDSVVARGTMFV